MRVLRRLVLSVCMLLVMAAPSSPARGASTIVVGFVGTLSGAVALDGQLSSRGASLAVDQINAAGGVRVHGDRYTLQLVLEDDQGQSVAGINAVNRLIEEDRAFAILGSDFSNVVIPTLPITTQHKVIQLYSTNATLGNGVPRLYAFRSRVEDSYLARAVVRYIVRDLKGTRRVGLSLLNNQYGQAGGAQLAAGLKKAGVPVVAQVSHNFGDPDLTPNAAAMIQGKATVVVTWTGPVEAVSLLRALRNLGWKGTFIDGNPDSIFAAVGKSEVDGVVGPQGWAPTDRSARSRAFVRAYEARYHQTPDDHAAAYYDAVYLLRAALQARGLNVDRVRDYIASMKRWEGVQGRFHPASLTRGNLITRVVLVRVEHGVLKILRVAHE